MILTILSGTQFNIHCSLLYPYLLAAAGSEPEESLPLRFSSLSSEPLSRQPRWSWRRGWLPESVEEGRWWNRQSEKSRERFRLPSIQWTEPNAGVARRVITAPSHQPLSLFSCWHGLSRPFLPLLRLLMSPSTLTIAYAMPTLNKTEKNGNIIIWLYYGFYFWWFSNEDLALNLRCILKLFIWLRQSEAMSM